MKIYIVVKRVKKQRRHKEHAETRESLTKLNLTNRRVEKLKKIMLPIMSAVVVVSTLISSQASAATTTFKDVQANHWAKSAIESAVSMGYFKGYGNGLFKPNASVTRAEFASLISRVAKDMTLPEDAQTDSFKDLNGHWSKAEVDRAVTLGFINTKEYPNGFKPSTPITREEMAKWLSSGLVASSAEYKTAFAETKGTLLPVKESFKPGIAQDKIPYLAVAMGTNLMNGFPDGSFGMDKTTTRAGIFCYFVTSRKCTEKRSYDI